MIKAVVVDDEKLVRKGFISMMNWEAFGMVIVGEAADGPSALELLSCTEVDLLFVDITMPGMSGLELIRQVRQQFPRIRPVVLTCHHEFDYIQEALRLGAIDYIVKTLLELENADDTIRRIAERLRWEESVRPSVFQDDVRNAMPASRALVFRPLAREAEQSELFSLTAVRSNPFLQSDGLCMVPLVHPLQPAELARELPRVSSLRWQTISISGLGDRTVKEVQEALTAYLDCALFYRMDQAYPPALEYSAVLECARPQASSHWQEPFWDLKWVFCLQDWNSLVRSIEASHPPETEIAAFAQKLCQDWRGLLPSHTDSAQLEEAMSSNKAWLQWKSWLRRFADCAQRRMVELAFSKEVMLALIGAMDFLRKHSCEKINQADVADHVKMSRSYFSQCFSRFAGEPFNVVLRNLRMDHAKAFLLESDTPVYEIAMSVGFEDDKYFSKLFRELVGKYPTEFRMLGGKPF